MSTLGFDNYVEPLKLYLQKYRESMKGEKVINAAGGRPETLPEELDEDQYSTHTLAAANIITEQTGQQNIAYTSTYQNQIGQQIHYG
ncbi:nuclear transcription factor Y subunit beta-like [Saccoglossus kowalevskii]